MNFGSIDMRKVSLAFDIAWTIGILLLHLVLLVFLGFQYTAENITNVTFFIVYIVLGVISFVFTATSAFYNIFDRKHDTLAEKGLASALYVSDTTSANPAQLSTRFLSNLVVKFTVVAALVLLTAIFILAPGAARSAVPVYNPYTSEALSQSVLEEHPLLLNMFNIAAYPGLFEEGPIFFLVNTIVMVITFGVALLFRNPGLRTNVAVFLIAVIIAVPSGAALFTVAHNAAYDLDTQAKVSAFTFEILVQTANQLTGSFISWIVHAVHNALVVFKTQTAFAVGGVTAFVIVPLHQGIIGLYRTVFAALRVQVIQDWRELRRAVAA